MGGGKQECKKYTDHIFLENIKDKPENVANLKDVLKDK